MRIVTFNGRFGLAHVEHDVPSGRFLVVDGWTDPPRVLGARSSREEAEREARGFAGLIVPAPEPTTRA